MTFNAINAPKRIAVVPEPGIPRVKSGTKDPVHAALLAVSGAAKPFIDPLPNSFCSCFEAMLRSTAYELHSVVAFLTAQNTATTLGEFVLFLICLMYVWGFGGG